MIEILNPLRDFSVMAVMFRVILAVICGGLIGLEREYKRRPAGFRTHILICLGAAMTTLTSQYLVLEMNYNTDPARLGAQVVAGIGFIGAGCIIVTRRRRVKGLTTAAGLWTTAIVGLACGAGFYEGVIIATALVLLAEMLFFRLEYQLIRSSREVTLYVEYKRGAALDEIIRCLRGAGCRINDMEMTRVRDEEDQDCAIFSLMMNKKADYSSMLISLTGLDGVIMAQEL
jgi:putative Mg2+ transporter-C (MgtC) family protein